MDVGVERRPLAGLPAEGQRVPREAAEERDVPGLHLRVHDVRVHLAERARVLADDGQVVLAGAGHVAPGIRRDGDAGVGCLLHHRQHRVTEVRVGDDQADMLCDRRLEVGDPLVQVGVGAAVDDLADLRIRQRLEDELHLRHLAVDVLAELLDVGDGELASGPGAAAVVLPAFERQGVVHLLVGAPEGGQRDVARVRVLRQELGVEERVREGAGPRPVHLAVPASLADEHGPRACSLLLAGAAETARGEYDSRREQRKHQHRHHRAPPSRRGLLRYVHRALLS